MAGCCDKIIKKTKNIFVGYVNLVKGAKFEFTDDRIRICQKCNKSYWLDRSLWCSICKCYIPAKARVKEEKCPKNKWPNNERLQAR
ncbi:MAG: hypothetical protein ACE5HX_04425 [bacterium]